MRCIHVYCRSLSSSFNREKRIRAIIVQVGDSHNVSAFREVKCLKISWHLRIQADNIEIKTFDTEKLSLRVLT